VAIVNSTLPFVSERAPNDYESAAGRCVAQRRMPNVWSGLIVAEAMFGALTDYERA
jgi:hypothetical protein